MTVPSEEDLDDYTAFLAHSLREQKKRTEEAEAALADAREIIRDSKRMIRLRSSILQWLPLVKEFLDGTEPTDPDFHLTEKEVST